MEKKKYLIEITETQLPTDDFNNIETRPAPGFYINTPPETDLPGVQFWVVPKTPTFSAITLWDWPAPGELKNLFGEPLEDIPPAPELEAIPELIAGISEDALLKAIVLVQNPELAKDIL